jgi:hypothetical protein
MNTQPRAHTAGRPKHAAWILHLPAQTLVALARLYQHTLGMVLPDTCRFTPTCSEYFARAVRKHGALRGAWLGVKRILRCNRYFEGGNDPVP